MASQSHEIASPIPSLIGNWIAGKEEPAFSGQTFPKICPADGQWLCDVARSEDADVSKAVAAAKNAWGEWSGLTPVHRGEILRNVALTMRDRQREVARIVALETAKSPREALGETQGAIELGMFMAGEGRRLYGRTTTSAVPNRSAMTVRQPLGVAGLIIAANTPIANVAWKVFPALICGNTAVLKAAEDAPATAWMFGKLAHESGLPAGVLNIIQGYGAEAGAPLVKNNDVAVISFTGSTSVGRDIAVEAGKRLARVSLELGGKNPLVVCEDADLDNAATWTILSAFSNAGQRCAAASRIIIFDAIYSRFREMLLDRIKRLKVGPRDDDDFGPVINERQLSRMIGAVEQARRSGAIVLTGGFRLTGPAHENGFYMAPTLIENADPHHQISKDEMFGPIACLYRAAGLKEALELANDSPYGLTASIHTKNLDRAMYFIQNAQVGVVSVNAGTYGSEPHMPFGGLKQSGNGSREPGTEALDVYSSLKDVYVTADPASL